MEYIPRAVTQLLHQASQQFPAVLVTGARQCGKTTLLRHAFPSATHILLEDPDVIARVRSDPRGFLDGIEPPVILDEIQNTPELLAYVRTRVDENPAIKGHWLLTGSQEAPLMRGVTESMAGRAAVLELFPLSSVETAKVNILHGGFPDVVLNPGNAELWFRSYVQTYLERDVRSVTAVKDLATFRRFMALLASRHGQILNKTDLAAPLGVSVPTITAWLSVLEVTGQIILIPPFFENFGKRLIKSPRLYFLDSGLVCHLLGVEHEQALVRSPFYGSLFEGFAASEIIKHQASCGRRRELYCFRDQQGLEVDFIVPQGVGQLLLVECKTTTTPTPSQAHAMRRLTQSIKGYSVEAFLLHGGAGESIAGSTLVPGVATGPLSHLIARLRGA